METMCSSQPTVYQKQQTDIVLRTDPSLVDAAGQAKAALSADDPAKATQILEQATAVDVCSALAAVDAEIDPDAQSQRLSEELAYEQNYRRIAAAYEAEPTTVGCRQQRHG